MNVNFKRLLFLLIPTFLRKGIIKSFLKAISEALKECKNDIDKYFAELDYHLRITPQTFCLEKMLNDKCDPILRRIYITLPEPQSKFYFSLNGEPEMRYFSEDTYFMFKNSGYAYDFCVFLPSDIESEETTNKVTALLNKYKLLSKTFKIQYV
jgi:hypothetical protein